MKTNLLLLAICLFVVVPLSACAEELDGGQVYSRYCGTCHNFRPPGEKGDREWEMAIGHMRSVAGLTGPEARAVAKFLEVKTPEQPSALSTTRDLQPALSGAEIVEKSQCRACHNIGNKGGTVGPNLNGVLSHRSREYIIAQIKDPHAHNPSSTMPPHDFSAAELENLIKYLASNK